MKELIQYTDRLNLYTIILLVTGLLLRCLIGRRRFNRRGIAGPQHFKSYKIALITVVLEKVFNLLGLICIVSSIILLVIK